MNGAPDHLDPQSEADIRELMLALAADALEDPSQARALLASGDVRYVSAFAEAQAFLASLPGALPPVRPPSAVRENLMGRVQTIGQSTAFDKPIVLPRRIRWLARALAASVVLALGAIVMILLVDRDRRVKDTRAELTSRDLLIRLRDEQIKALEAAIGSANLKLVSLAADGAPATRGRVFWDLEKNRWHFYVFDLAPPPPGRTYELWFIGKDGRKTPAGTFDVDSEGKGSLIAQVPAGVGPIALAAVTDEPWGGSAAPTGSIRLKGEVQ